MGLWLQSLGPDRKTSLDAPGKAHGPIAALHNEKQYTGYDAACRGLFCVQAQGESERAGPEQVAGRSAVRRTLTC